MEIPAEPRRVIQFGVFEVDFQARELRKSGVKLRLPAQPFQVLAILLERPGQVVTHEELRARLWPADTFVDFDHSLGTAINKIREALCDTAENPRFVETRPRHGYRFIGPISEAPSTAVERGKPPPLRRKFMIGVAIAAAAVVLIAALLGLNVGGLRQRMFATSAPTRIQSLAVLPLTNLSGDPAEEYFSDGMTDALITDLAQIGFLKVISRTSVMRYKKTDKSLPEIARELNVDGIVEGTVQRSGDHVRITAQLIEAPTDRHLWAESYERDLRDVLVLEREVARAIAKEIEVKVSPQEQVRLANSRSVNPAAYEAYLRGRYYWNKRELGGFKKALEFFNQAVEKDPASGSGYAGPADTYTLMGAAGYDVLPTSDAMQKAKAAALKAVELDDTLTEAHASLAFVVYSYDWNWAAAEREFKRAISLNPGYATAHQWYSEFLSAMGRSDEAMAEATIALALDPFSPIISQNAARPYYYARRFDQAIERSRKALQLDPTFAIVHLRLGRAYAAKGMYSDATSEFEKFSTLGGSETLAIASIGNARSQSGDKRGALQMVEQLVVAKRQRQVPSYQFAMVYSGLGDKDAAVTWLEKAFSERSDLLTFLGVEPLFDPLRNDPRFQNLLRRMNFPGAETRDNESH